MLRTVRLELARRPEFPEGSPAYGYELHLPLAADATLDRGSWQKHRSGISFFRFWGDEEGRGHLTHNRKGWWLVFEDGGGDVEVILHADTHRFASGEYVSIKERGGVTRTFRFASVARAEPGFPAPHLVAAAHRRFRAADRMKP